MPFTKPEKRNKINNLDQFQQQVFLNGDLKDTDVGDRCFYFYKKMMKKWKKERRWTTAHNIYKQMKDDLKLLSNKDTQTAYKLAWQVFFNLRVMPYELEKQKENGEII